MRRTKIVATIGPATDSPEALHAVIAAGADVVRLNAAHGDGTVHTARAELARRTASELDRSIGVLVDLPGPKMRSGPIADEIANLVAGNPYTLVGPDGADTPGDDRGTTTTMPDLARWVRPGDDVFLADGAIVLRVTGTRGADVDTEIVRGGTLRSRKGMHVPRAERHVESFTDRDRDALAMAIDLRADFVGLSFVRTPDDVDRVRALLPKRGQRPALVAKIETASALDHLPGIVAAADAVMVARGDLGIQVPARRVPLIQKEIISYCNMAGRPVITATQMLESMTHAPQPTRAEASDVANAVWDGTDAVMLSGETAIGDYPVETVRTMADSLGARVIALEADEHDALVAMVSHVPHLTAATLMDMAAAMGEEHGALLQLAAGGFRDMTRIAAGRPDIWPGICDDNAGAIVMTLDHLIARLGAVRDQVAAGDHAGLLATLGRAAEARRSLGQRAPRPEALVEVRVPVEDRPGSFAAIAVLATELGINLYDVEIAHSAEGEGGVLVLVIDAEAGPRFAEALAGRGHRSATSPLSTTR